MSEALSVPERAPAPAPAGVSRLSAVVPATDGPATVASCLEAIQAAHDGPDELIVVRGGNGDGAARARNEGAFDATGEVLVFVDADVAVHPDAFARIRRAFQEDPGLAAVFGSYDDRPQGAGALSAFRNLLHHHVHQTSAGPAETFWAGLGAVRREAFMAMGGFDPGSRPRRSVEDIELGMRLIAAGERIVLDPELLGTHLKPWTLASMVRTDLLNRGVPWVLLLLPRRRAPSTLNLAWRHRATALCWVAAVGAVATGRPRAAAAAVAGSGWLNRSFYALLRRRRGTPEAALGVLLHGVHHLTAVVSVALGFAAHLRRRSRD